MNLQYTWIPPVMFIGLIVASLAFVGCSENRKVGLLELNGTRAAKFTISIDARTFPERRLQFHARNMSAYSEPIYESEVEIRVVNSGNERYRAALAGSQFGPQVKPGDHLNLGKVAFKHLAINITDLVGEEAVVKLELIFDAAYVTRDSWELYSSWADGP